MVAWDGYLDEQDDNRRLQFQVHGFRYPEKAPRGPVRKKTFREMTAGHKRTVIRKPTKT